MEDAELQAIRQARLAEMQRNNGGGPAVGAGAQGAEVQQAQQQQEEEMRSSLLSQVLTTEARERLSRIRIVKADRARNVEDLILRMARSGQIQRKVSEDELVSLLSQISQQESKVNSTKIVFDRRGAEDDDDLPSSSKNVNHDDDDDDFFD